MALESCRLDRLLRRMDYIWIRPMPLLALLMARPVETQPPVVLLPLRLIPWGVCKACRSFHRPARPQVMANRT